MRFAARILDAWRCGWRAACERWRKAGAILTEAGLRAGRKSKDGNAVTLTALSITQNESKRWQRDGKTRTSWFDLDPDELRKVLPRSPEQEEAAEAERWWRSHSRMGWRR